MRLMVLLLSSSLLVINNVWSPRQRQRQRRLRPVVPVTFVFAIAAAVILDRWIIFLSMKMYMNPAKAFLVGRRRFPFLLHVDAWSPSDAAAVTSGAVSRRSIVLKSKNNKGLLPIACHPPPSSFLKRRSTPLCLKYMSSVAELVEDSSNDNNDTEYDATTTTATTINKKMMFQLTTPYEPTGDQPQAIETLVDQIERGDKYSVLRGITGSGKSFVMANTIARVNRPTLILCHNKTLAAQLARELRSCLSKNHVHLFVSYYNHYIPESYNETTDRYTKKKSSVNDELDALRHLATRSLVQHRDVVVVSSVSCIYGLGMPKAYLDASVNWKVGDLVGEKLTDIHEIMASLLYMTPEEAQMNSNNTSNTADDGRKGKRKVNDYSDELNRGNYQLSDGGSVASLMVWPPSESFPIRVGMKKHQDGYRITSIGHGHSNGMKPVKSTTIFPAKHHIKGSQEEFDETLQRIQQELQWRVTELQEEGKVAEADRLSHRVSQDLLMLRETGTCSGVENYSRHMALREEGQPPDTLLDYFGNSVRTQNGNGATNDLVKNLPDWLLIVDESHVTIPQLKAMYAGDRARKEKLVKHGYRLPSALDNRPLRSDEFWRRIPQAVFVSATPAKYELDLIQGKNMPVEMIIRPTFVCDPEISVRPIKNQLDDLLSEIQERAKRNERTLAMTLTKRDAEDLASYLLDHGISSTYIHSGLNTHERSNALKSLQHGEIDCLVGVNLLREGLDLPQVSLVAILNADSEGFLRSEAALLQTIGRAARNLNGQAILYANRVTQSMQKCIDSTAYRRQVQLDYNQKNKKEMRSTKGSSVLSIFDLLKDQIEAETPIEVVKSSDAKPIQLQHQEIEPSHHRIISKNAVETDHLPSKPGVYMWKDQHNNILYIGKAKKLRNRVKSYLAQSAKHSSRIMVMLSKAKSVEFMLCPSERDALLLENNMIKHHQPPYNVLLKDDETYPYICATIGDPFPSFTVVPRRMEGERASKYKYFGPYPQYAEINRVLQGIEEEYDLRSKSFQARFGDVSKAEYQKLFHKVLHESFESKSGGNEIVTLRSSYEEASLLFDSEYNKSRDVVAVGKSDDGRSVVVHVLQLRSGLIAGQFSYECQLAEGLNCDDDFADAMQLVLEKRHYPSGGSSTKNGFSFFPDEILLQFEPPQLGQLQDVIRSSQQVVEKASKRKIKIRTPSTRGSRSESDARCLQCAVENAVEVANQKSLVKTDNVPLSSVDGRAIRELAEMLSLDKLPHKIECYDISHTQGLGTVGSRIVYVDGRPRRDLYRTFNVRGVKGPDDYASLEEVLERRFRHIWRGDDDTSGKLVDDSDPWSLPDLIVIDGGKGQLSAAMKGMRKVNVLPATISFSVSDRISTVADDSGIDVGVGTEDLVVSEEEFPPPRGRAVRIPIVALAKKKEEVFVEGESNPLIDTESGSDSAALLLLRALRDESHRFALKAHRKRRTKSMGL